MNWMIQRKEKSGWLTIGTFTERKHANAEFLRVRHNNAAGSYRLVSFRVEEEHDGDAALKTMFDGRRRW